MEYKGPARTQTPRQPKPQSEAWVTQPV
jgi:hypothetical protein